MTDPVRTPDQVLQDDDTAWPENSRPTDDPQSPDGREEDRQGPGGDPVEGAEQLLPD